MFLHIALSEVFLQKLIKIARNKNNITNHSVKNAYFIIFVPYYDLQSDDMAISSPTDMCIITTIGVRCNVKMCSIWQNPTEKAKKYNGKGARKTPQSKICESQSEVNHLYGKILKKLSR